MGMIAAAAITAGAGAAAANQQKKAAQKAAEAGKAVPVDIADVSRQAEEQARRNIINSISLEEQFDPGVAMARKNAMAQYNAALGGENPLLTEAKKSAMQLGTGPTVSYDSPAIRDAVAQAMAQSRKSAVPFAELPVEVSNLATRKALGTAAKVGGGGLNLGRDLVARDLGLTSLQLGQQAEQNQMNRIAALLGAGGAELNINEGNARFGYDQLQGGLQARIGALSNLAGQDYTRALSAAQFTQAMQRPEVGLDPSAIANLATGNVATQNQNAQNQANMIMNQANANSQLYGQLAGAAGSAAGAYFNRPTTTSNGPTSTYADFLKNNPKPGTSGNYAVNYQPNPTYSAIA
jgi:hypothetical protein